MPSKSVSASMTTIPSTSGSTEPATSPQPKKAQVIFLQRSPKLIISRNGGETVQHFILTQQPIVNVSDFRAAPTSTGVAGSASNDTVIIGTSSGATVDTFRQSGTTSTSTSHHHQPLDDEVTNATYVYTTEYPPYYQYQPIHSPTQQTYVIQQQGSPGSVEEDVGAQLGHTTRASPATIQWLINNYEPADGTSLPRCTLYSHYIKHCNENKLEPVNAASFGKLIRSVFHGLRTRRLGTRGNSKYHYYGIRIKPDSPLNRGSSVAMTLGEDYNRTPLISSAQSVNQLPPRSSSRRSTLGSNSVITRRTSSTVMETDTALSQSINSRSSPPSTYEHSISSNHGTFSTYRNQNANPLIGGDNCTDMDREILGDGEVPHVGIPDMQGLESYLQPLGLTLQHAVRFIESYTTNCAEVLECVKQLHFDVVEECWITFWQPENDQDDVEDEDCASNDKTLKGLSQIQLFRLCTVPQMQAFVQNMDFSFYQVIVEVLIPDVLSSNISGALTLQIRNFAKSLEIQLKKAMQGAPDVIQKKKLVAVRTLAQTLRRYTSLNHLASAARGVLQKPDQIHQMLQDFNRVDIASVQDQAGWVCDCDPVLVSNLQSDFRENLQKQKSLEQWAEWMEAVVDQVLAKYHDKPYGVLADVSKHFLKNWSFYSSMIIRDLTLRSAQSFGSFHLIRLLFDEYLLYLVELRLAKASNKPVIYVMTQVMQNIILNETTAVGTGGMEILAPQPIVASNGIGLLPTGNNSHFFTSLEAHPGVNIVYMDERSGHTQTIHYVGVGSNTPPHMDTLEQIVQSSEMTLEDVKNDLDEGERKNLNLI
ncbi:transcription factor RFX3 [Loa loa]|uniref:Transcription factor RFX3 n=1 Tax=Loa loa TaxID=7209 RepID=A0A1S0UJG5_LOALO|nr:transcription factor RFX3 [Loa loa]EJD75673.1 transcription factor RFX3 [Loa loa]